MSLNIKQLSENTKANINDGATYIQDIINKGQACAINKMGVGENGILLEFINSNETVDLKQSVYNNLYVNVGVFPKNKTIFKQWCKYYYECLLNSDTFIFVTPYCVDIMINELINSKYKNKIQKILDRKILASRCLEPFYANFYWTKALENKRVLVVSPFTDTITKQYKKRDLIWKNHQGLLPNFTLLTIKVPQSQVLTGSDKYEDWFDAFNDIKSQMQMMDFDVCLVGAGGYSVPVTIVAKMKGKIGIYIGGGLQILFGVKGKRWDKHDIISKLYNEHWVYPSKSETPKNARLVENGCYWG